MKTIPKLTEILSYKNDLVVRRFIQNHPEYKGNAQNLFAEMLKFLWLMMLYDQEKEKCPDHPKLQFVPVMHIEMRDMDNMWHEFILITRDYHSFCEEYFGTYIHHVPNMQETLQLDQQQFTDQLTLFLEFIYDHLGEQTVVLWFNEHL